jgi:two-component system CheB/CheR fusion protein
MDADPDIAANALIVVGASAGGIEALGRLVASLPADLPAPVVIAQHLDPARPSHLGDILTHHTALPVRTVTGRETLTPGTIFVVPSNRHVVIADQHVEVHSDATLRPTPSVDLLLSSAAETFGEHLIAVILTGSGSDGAAGAHAVKEAGGTVIIQDPTTAAFPAMPRALAPSLVDVIAPIERIGSLLAELLGHSSVTVLDRDRDLTRLLDHLRARHSIDFSAYKRGTILRRFARRMAAANVSTTDDYLRYLAEHPEEEPRLIADFLIKVTRFFRDAELFAHLREELIPELVAAARAGTGELRLWSAGCATGEEAYSLALLVAEALAKSGGELPVRIFATDVDETALDFARRGIYPASTLADVPPELVAQSFTEHEGSFQISKDVRSLIVFGTHNLGQRPPFPRTDLILCRNVLIYFTQELQQRALEIFAYSLRDDGYLVLGKSETVGRIGQVYAVVDRSLHIYRRHGPRAMLPPARLAPVAAPTTAEPGTVAPRSSAVLEVALRQAEDATGDARQLGERAEELVRQLPVGVVVVNRAYDVEFINGAARELLGLYGTVLGQDLIHLVPSPIAPLVRAGIDTALQRASTREDDLLIPTETATGKTCHLRLTCQPERRDGAGQVTTVLLLLTDVTALVESHQASAATAAEVAPLQARVDRLAGTNQHLLTANRELTDAVDRLHDQGDEFRVAMAAAQVSAEEIETLNEELQATNEELETMHEEAQATVEELNVSNDELQARARELEELAITHSMEQARLAALLAGMADAVLVVDHQGRAVRTNAAYDALVRSLGGAMVPADEQEIPLPPAQTPQQRAARGEAFQLEFILIAADGARRWFEATGRPLGAEDAGVLVIRDITDRTLRRLQEEFLTWAGHELRTPLTALQGYLQLAERRIPPHADERLQRYLTFAIEEARRQSVLVTELIDAARLHSGKLDLQREPLDLGALLVHTVELAQVLTQGQTIAVEGTEEPIVIEGDANRLEQVLLNLLTNAITHAPDSEQISVRLHREVEVAILDVQDAGPGIPVEELETIFERFAQLNPTQRAGRSGLGLGLYIAREIVEAHGGIITAHSVPGEGATFTVQLPILAAGSIRR